MNFLGVRGEGWYDLFVVDAVNSQRNMFVTCAKLGTLCRPKLYDRPRYTPCHKLKNVFTLIGQGRGNKSTICTKVEHSWSLGYEVPRSLKFAESPSIQHERNQAWTHEHKLVQCDTTTCKCSPNSVTSIQRFLTFNYFHLCLGLTGDVTPVFNFNKYLITQVIFW